MIVTHEKELSFKQTLWDQYPREIPKQSQEVQAKREILKIANEVCRRINQESPRIASFDTRPKKTSSADEPNVANPYVAQSLLEEVIEELQRCV